mmetsp:Transcript_89055/g.203708  ORF Transcript_89055/g.203708 Transcript_89055/m.203708 type:complete len:332 (-) Transcript_89055:7-1002(-)
MLPANRSSMAYFALLMLNSCKKLKTTPTPIIDHRRVGHTRYCTYLRRRFGVAEPWLTSPLMKLNMGITTSANDLTTKLAWYWPPYIQVTVSMLVPPSFQYIKWPPIIPTINRHLALSRIASRPTSCTGRSSISSHTRRQTISPTIAPTSVSPKQAQVSVVTDPMPGSACSATCRATASLWPRLISSSQSKACGAGGGIGMPPKVLGAAADSPAGAASFFSSPDAPVLALGASWPLVAAEGAPELRLSVAVAGDAEEATAWVKTVGCASETARCAGVRCRKRWLCSMHMPSLEASPATEASRAQKTFMTGRFTIKMRARSKQRAEANASAST